MRALLLSYVGFLVARSLFWPDADARSGAAFNLLVLAAFLLFGMATALRDRQRKREEAAHTDLIQAFDDAPPAR